MSVDSADGVVSLEIPPGAGVDPATVTVETIPDDERALEARNAETTNGSLAGSAYRLGPDGATFSEPVTITYRATRADLEVDPDADEPELTLALRAADGSWEALQDSVVTVDGDDLLITATTTHFSDLYLLENWLVWLVCGGVIHEPLDGDHPSYLWMFFAMIYGLFPYEVRFTYTDGESEVLSDPVDISFAVFDTQFGITSFGDKTITKVEILRDGVVVSEANVTDQVYAQIGGRTLHVGPEEGYLEGREDPCLEFYTD